MNPLLIDVLEQIAVHAVRVLAAALVKHAFDQAKKHW